MKKKVISLKNIPSPPPILTTIVLLLAVDVWGWTGFGAVVVGVTIGALWWLWIFQRIAERQVDIFEEGI